MDADQRIERALEQVVDEATAGACPPGLAAAVRYAVFPGGARLRPRLCLAVAAACGEDDPTISERAGAAIELVHCASLVHDDLPCFDDSPLRRGRPSVHEAYGERLAVLAGDALIVTAFESLARGAASAPERLPALLGTIGRAVGMPEGLCAGQAWECEAEVERDAYQRAKTGALFAAATVAGAAAAGVPAEPWRTLGERIGAAYQVVDDIRDVAGDAAEMGKPTGQDAAHGRPSAARDLGVEGALAHHARMLDDVVASIPDCPGREWLETIILEEARRFLPADSAVSAG